MQAILSNGKRHLRKADVRQIKIPLWPELGLSKVFPEAVQLPGFTQHIPEEWMADSKKAERTFFWAVLMTLAPEFVEELILDVR